MSERPRRRLNALASILALICLLIVVKLVDIQVIQHARLVDEGERTRQTHQDLKPVRGQVWDRNGNLLIGNVVKYDVSASPPLVSDPAFTAVFLSHVLGMDARDLMDSLTSDEGWVPIARQVPKESGDKIIDKGLVGVAVDPVWRRTLPEGTLAAHLLGFVNADGVGYYGVEGYYDEQLKGIQGSREYQRDSWNLFIPLSLVEEQPCEPGADLVLTVDRTVQALVEAELYQALQDTGAESGVIIVMNPRTGEILALAAAPTYDPNRFWEANAKLFVNPAVSGQYEPGSVFKVLTVAIALQEEIVTPDQTFYDEGIIEVGGQEIRNATRVAYGEVTLAQVLAYSLNVEVAKLSTMLGPENFYRGLKAFGIDRLTGVDLEGEIVGELRAPGDPAWHESDLGTNAFGQGLAVTPMQMIVAVSALANDGLLMKPYVVAEQHFADGRIKRAQPAPADRAVSSEVAHIVAEMMARAVDQEISPAQVPGYRVAGKTGTAQYPVPGGYDDKLTIASFVGFAPVHDPQIIVLVRLDKPTSSPWGSETAAPVFARLAQRLFVLLDIPPDAYRVASSSYFDIPHPEAGEGD